MDRCVEGETIISYITRTHAVTNSTPIGLLIVNYLLNTKTHPSANIIGIDSKGEQFSLYSFDLNDDIGRTDVGTMLIVGTSRFADETEKFLALEALKFYLESIERRLFDDQRLLEDVLDILNQKPRLQVHENISLYRGDSVRASIPNNTYGNSRNSKRPPILKL